MGGTAKVSGTLPLTTDQDRLYADLDEFQFTPARAAQNLGTSSSASTLEQQDIETYRFFLTAHSKAPEINLFGPPPGCNVASLG